MANKRAFLSFKMEDKNQVQGLRLLAATPLYDLEFYDESVRSAINSENADYIKRVIREKIIRTSVTVCLIGTNTHKSAWVDWELQESDSQGNTIITMALKGIDRATLPTLIKNKKLTFYPWDPANLAKLIERA